MKYLLGVTEKYRVSNENEALKFIEDTKNDNRYVLNKYATQKKEIKQKGEVVEEYVIVSLTKIFNSEKEPTDEIEISYEEGSAF